MKKFLLSVSALLLCSSLAQADLVISQYAEDGDIKGVEVWNSGPGDITFNTTDMLLQLSNHNNGGTPATFTFSKNSGTLVAGDVLVFADGSNNSIWADSGIVFEEANFSFNGDDALLLQLGGVTTDMFGTVGSDPGNSWTGGGTDTRDQNIQLISGITAGDTDGWSDPSTRFEFVAQDPLDAVGGTNLLGFGVAPGGAAVPEPSSLGVLALLGLGLFRRKRS